MTEQNTTTRITLEVSSTSRPVERLADQFCGILVQQWKIGEPAPFGKTHHYNYVQLLVGEGDYSNALREAKAWLVENSWHVSQFSLKHESAGITISIPFAPDDENRNVVSSARTIRVPFPMIQLCYDSHLEISFGVTYNRDHAG